MKRILFLVFCLLLICTVVYSATLSIPASRRTTWAGNVGVTGGIPERTVNCVTAACLTLCGTGSDATSCTGTDAVVTTDSIDAAIDSAVNDTVVRIPAGTYTLGSRLTISRSHFVLRGAGMGATILKPNFADSTAIFVYGFSYSGGSSGTVTSGYTQGSTEIVVNNATGVLVGSGITISESDEDFMFSAHSTNEGHLLHVLSMVTNVSGNTITLATPLPYTFSAAHTPTFSSGLYALIRHSIGIENLSIDATDFIGGVYGAIGYQGTAESWIKNVEVGPFDGQAIFIVQSSRITVTGCYLHDTFSSQEGYGITAYLDTSGLLIENNRGVNMTTFVELNNSTGSVVAYNYMKDPHMNLGSHVMSGILTNHSSGGLMNLYEGNHTNRFTTDSYHGGHSYDTLYRNRFDDLHTLILNDHWYIVDIARWAWYHTIIGNILGTAAYTPPAYERLTGITHGEIYRLGYPYSGSNYYDDPPSSDHCYWTVKTGSGYGDYCPIDPGAQSTLVRHRNYDYFNSAIRSCTDETEGCQGVTGNELPDSLYLTSKPSWWCQESTWPPVNPDIPSVSDIPAKRSFDGVVCSFYGYIIVGNTTASGASRTMGSTTASGAGITLQ